MNLKSKRILAAILALVMVICLLPVMAFAEGEAAAFTATAGGAELAVSVEKEAYEYFDYMANEAKKADLYTVVVPPCGADKVELDFGENEFIFYAYDADGVYVKGYCDDSGTVGQSKVEIPDLDSFIWVQTPYAADYSSGGDMQFVVCFKPMFTARLGGEVLTDVTVKKDAYKYTFSYLGAPTEYIVDLYTIRIPYGAEEIAFEFAANCLAYNYQGVGEDPVAVDGDDNGSWLDGYYEDYMTGAADAAVKVDANNDGAADYVQIQAPYDENWNSPVLYAIAFSYIFGASVDGEPMTDVEAAEGAYPTFTYDPETWEAVPADPVTLYTVALPENTAEVELAFPEGVLAYNYKADGQTFIAGNYEGDALSQGVTSVKVAVDADADGEPDCIQVQTPFDENYNSTVLYAITFKVGGLTPGAQTEITAEELRDNIAAKLAGTGVADDSNAAWFAADMMAYEGLFPETESKLSDAQKQAMANKAIEAIAAAASPSDAAKNIIALCAMGFDPRQIKTSSGEELDGVAKLDELTFAEDGALTDGASSIYSMPYILIAYEQFSDCEDQCLKLVDAAVAAKDGWLDTTWGVDAITPMLLALAPYGPKAEVEAAFDEAIKALEAAQVEDGSIADFSGSGNAASTGLAMAGLKAIGTDPAEYTHGASGKSLKDGIVTFAGEDGASLNPTSSSYSTEQGFRGLIALSAADRMYRIYDFSGNIEERVPAAYAIDDFDDVPPEHWAYENVMSLASKGVIKGYGNGLFGVDDPIARRDIVVILYRLAGAEETEYTGAFTDVPDGEYYSLAIEWAAKNDIVNGVGDGTFRPDEDISREQLATILYRCAVKFGVTLPEGESKTFTDADQISDFAVEAVNAMSAAQIINGTPEGAFDPAGSATRAQAAKMIDKLVSIAG